MHWQLHLNARSFDQVDECILGDTSQTIFDRSFDPTLGCTAAMTQRRVFMYLYSDLSLFVLRVVLDFAALLEEQTMIAPIGHPVYPPAKQHTSNHTCASSMHGGSPAPCSSLKGIQKYVPLESQGALYHMRLQHCGKETLNNLKITAIDFAPFAP